uniref:DNA polymerase delta subunit 3 n=1 Tax=Syphacia muris TaxID=451379 RepID=A0A0N5AW89_9BILA
MNLTAEKALKCSWVSAGFSHSKNYAFKLYLQDGLLTTLITDYRTIYAEEVVLKKKFSELNTKLSGPDDILFSKVCDLFKSKLSNHSLTVDQQSHKLTINLETKLGKRMVKWRFNGDAVSNDGDIFYQHIVRPLLDMVTVAAENKAIVASKDEIQKLPALPDPFERVDVQELYKSIVSRPQYQYNVGCTEKNLDLPNKKIEDGNDGDQILPQASTTATLCDVPLKPLKSKRDEPQRLLGVKRDYKEEENCDGKGESDDGGSLSATPPLVLDEEANKKNVCQKASDRNVQALSSSDGKSGNLLEVKTPTTPKKSPKKPRLKF